MGVIVVNPQEERRPRPCRTSQPGEHGPIHILRAPLHFLGCGSLDEAAGRGERLVEGLEPLAQPEPSGEGEGSDEGPRPESPAFEDLRESGLLLGQDVPGVVQHSMGGRIPTCHDAGVGGKGDRSDGRHILEERSLGGKPVDPRSRRQASPVAAEMVRPKGVHRDQQERPVRLDRQQPATGQCRENDDEPNEPERRSAAATIRIALRAVLHLACALVAPRGL